MDVMDKLNNAWRKAQDGGDPEMADLIEDIMKDLNENGY